MTSAPTPDKAPLDPWQRLVSQVKGEVGEHHGGRGRVLKVKFGYNPNSSSVGSVITVLLWSASFAAMAVNVVNALLRSKAEKGLLPAAHGTEDSVGDGPTQKLDGEDGASP